MSYDNRVAWLKRCKYHEGSWRIEMDHEEVGRFWNANADAWTKLSRAGYDVYRDYLNTSAFFVILPDVDGLSELDIGCGESHNTRLLARRRAMVTAIDISEVFITHAKLAEEQEPLGIEYLVASAVKLPFAGATFDFGAAFMSLMDIPETDRALIGAIGGAAYGAPLLGAVFVGAAPLPLAAPAAGLIAIPVKTRPDPTAPRSPALFPAFEC
jgi:SAM-dependent methyltransferase